MNSQLITETSLTECHVTRLTFFLCIFVQIRCFQFAPWGFYKLLTQIREDYGNPPVIITENGFATYGGLMDDHRVLYYREYLSALLDAVEEGSDVRAYAAWSLMDNYEWMYGYT